MKIKHLGLIAFLSLFFVSAIIRLPFLNRALGDRHEWVLAHTLIPIENFTNYPTSQHLFRLIMTYPGQVNRYLMQTSTMRHMDEQGIGYYTTYPPLSAIIAYAIFKLTFLTPSILHLQVLNLIFHGLSALLLYQLIRHLATKHKTLAALTGSSIYLFAPAALWFMSVTYSWDIFWFYLLIATLYQLARIITQTHPSKLAFFSLGVLVGLTILTELQGIFLATSICIFTLVFNLDYKKNIIRTVMLGFVIAITLFLIQNALTQDLLSYAKNMINKFVVLYGTFGDTTLNPDYQESWRRYQLMLTPTFNLTLFIAFFTLISKQALNLLTKKQSYITVVCLLPFLMHASFMFTDIVIHEFASLAIIIPLAITAAFLVSNIDINKNHLPLFRSSLLLILLFFIITSVHDFQAEYQPSQLQYYQLAQQIKTDLASDEVLMFISPRPIPPIMDFYLKRNFALIKDPAEGQQILQVNGSAKAKIYELDEYRSIINIIPLINDQAISP